MSEPENIVDSEMTLKGQYGDMVFEIKEFGAEMAEALTYFGLMIEEWENFPGSEDDRKNVLGSIAMHMGEQMNHLYQVFNTAHINLFGQQFKPGHEPDCEHYGEDIEGDE